MIRVMPVRDPERKLRPAGRRGGDARLGGSLLAAAAVITAGVVLPATRAVVQGVDERWYRLVQQHRSPSLGAVSRVLDIALGTTVDWTVRIGVTALLARQRRWRALASWATTIALGEVSIGPVKGRIDRPRPADSLVRTTQTSYPSGHAVAAATALSRTYLNAHWLSDALGGFCLGGGFSLLVPRIVDTVAGRAAGPAGCRHGLRSGRS